MSVKIKNSKKEDEKVEIVNFDVNSFMAVEGQKGSGFEGKTKVVHKILGEKLIAKKFAKKVDADLEKKESPLRSSKDIPSKK